MKVKETGDEINLLNEYETAVLVFEEFLGSSNSRYKYQFFIRGRHKKIDIFYHHNPILIFQRELYKIIVTKQFCLFKR